MANNRSLPLYNDSILILVSGWKDKILLALSHAIFNLFLAFKSSLFLLFMSILNSFLNDCIQYLTKISSKSSPPRSVFPLCPNISSVGFSSSFIIFKQVTSRVPPPKSKTKIFFSS